MFVVCCVLLLVVGCRSLINVRCLLFVACCLLLVGCCLLVGEIVSEELVSW